MSCFISVLSQAEEMATLRSGSPNSRHFPWNPRPDSRQPFSLAHGVFTQAMRLMHAKLTRVWDRYEVPAEESARARCNASWYIERSFRRQGVERKCFPVRKPPETSNVRAAPITDILEIQCLCIS